MSLLLESVKVLNGKPCNLAYHQERVRRSSMMLFNIKGIDLYEIFDRQNLPETGLYKCRIIYDEKLKETGIAPYQKKLIKSSVVVDSGSFSYAFKYLDRKFFDDLKNKYPDFDEVILHHNGLISDSSFSNLAFFDGSQWLTPEVPLLCGTRRQQLLDKKSIKTASIRLDDLCRFHKVSFINALLDLDESVLSMDRMIVK